MDIGTTVSVDLVMDFWDGVGLSVAVMSAVAGAVAAGLAWRTVVVSERAQKADRDERRIAQALMTYGCLVQSLGPSIHLKVTNSSAQPISGVGGCWFNGGDFVKTLGGDILEAGESRVLNTMVIGAGVAGLSRADALIYFRDHAGVRWERRNMERPIEVTEDDASPPRRWWWKIFRNNS